MSCSIQRVAVLVGIALGIAVRRSARRRECRPESRRSWRSADFAAITGVEEPVDGGAAEFKSPVFQACVLRGCRSRLVKNCAVRVDAAARHAGCWRRCWRCRHSKVISGRPKSRGRGSEGASDVQADGRGVESVWSCAKNCSAKRFQPPRNSISDLVIDDCGCTTGTRSARGLGSWCCNPGATPPPTIASGKALIAVAEVVAPGEQIAIAAQVLVDFCRSRCRRDS